MTDITELTRRIDRLESRHLILELISKYAQVCDEHDLEGLGQLFTPDGLFESSTGTMEATGREGVKKMFVPIFQSRGPGMHRTHDIRLEFDDNDPNVASGLVYCHAETTPNGVACIASVKYFDKYRRTEGVWQFSHRVIHFMYYMPVTDYANKAVELDRIKVGEEWQEADYPEKLAPWLEFVSQYPTE